MSDLNLYNYFRSSTSYRVRIALELKGLDYAYTPVHLLHDGGEQFSEAYKSLNPLSGVPTLVHNGQALSQSFAIIEYLEDAFPQTTRLFPQDVFLKGKVRQFCEIINADIHPLQNLRVMQYLEKQAHFNADQKSTWLNKWIVKGLTAAEKTLEPYAGKYCFGDTVTAADLFLVPQLFSSQRFQIDISHFQLLSKIYENCNQLEAFKKAHPHRQPDTPEELRTP
ncbi:maleylacetoacetate isomerase [Pseudobdellovibrio exovorus]|uniref:Maleylacetoacetate isomerase / glutathione S-transferase n=1 Tax=Pseudobdellovibrio exovorus JSS TaxID=1184267 RepID=M4V655_9BACT|nr:maleylacetoacetate isomerase [Pseudobdellovibrio exovorus]AGH94673.1 maleylacetoacetate isomerase / glutathione S-transferase [Pseudobdellovibrio exovorus JSS]